jgi:SNF2 family DNA or RNA helicase
VNPFIADDVGLGKTIEAVLIACELLLRRRVREIVVACPPAMIPQWKDELEARFGLTFLPGTRSPEKYQTAAVTTERNVTDHRAATSDLPLPTCLTSPLRCIGLFVA